MEALQQQKTPQKTSYGSRSSVSDSAIAYPSRTIVHAKLEMTEPGDHDEQEADAAANDIVNGGKIRRKISGNGCSGTAVSPQVENQIAQLQGGGHAMPAGLRNMMENGFGRDFSQVRLHTDSQAADMSSSISARAFTHGNDIYFNRGQFSPNTSEGQRLVAHELTHVAQGTGKVGREPNKNNIMIHTDNFTIDKGQIYKKMNKMVRERYGEKIDFLNLQLNNNWITNKEYYDELNKIIDLDPDIKALRASYSVFDVTRSFMEENSKAFDVIHDSNGKELDGYKSFNENFENVNIHYLFGHGSPTSIQYAGKEYSISNIDEFIKDVLTPQHVGENDIIFLVSCFTGSEDGFAQHLSKKRPNNFIIAPNSYINPQLEVSAFDNEKMNYLFYNGELVSLDKNMLGNKDFFNRINDIIAVVEMNKMVKESNSKKKKHSGS